MRKLDLSGYAAGTPEMPIVYNVRETCKNILFSPQLRLQSNTLLDHFKLLGKIEKAEGDSILLEDAEFTLLEKAFKGVQGFGLPDVECVRRVLEAPKVENVVEKPEEGKDGK
jgi:hypothetical protein